MLRVLSIQNLAIAENITAEFGDGLNIITGETGAGKSLLVDALSLLKGSRFEPSLLRSGCESAHVTAQFLVTRNARVRQILQDMGLLGVEEENASVLTVRRSFFKNQKHRSFLNDTPVSSKSLQLVCAELIDINSQFDNQNLLDSHSHIRYLDKFSGLASQQAIYAKEFSEFLQIVKDVNSLIEGSAKRKRELELLRYEYDQILQAKLDKEEWQQVQETLTLGQKAAVGSKICSEMLSVISDGETNCVQFLKQCKRSMDKLTKLTPGTKLYVSSERFEEAMRQVDELSFELQRTLQQFSVDEEQIHLASERSEVYNRLLQKFGPSLDEVFSHAEHCKQMLEGDKRIDDELQVKLEIAAQKSIKLIKLAENLGSKRRLHLKPLSQEIEKELCELGMPKARFACVLDSNPAGTFAPFSLQWLTAKIGEKQLEQVTSLGRYGFESARFLLSANLGVEPQPLEKVASGGELSRIMLAIKGVLFDEESVSLFVFDEIDTGISGAIAAMVGKKLSNFCKSRQALCITHLPQVACYAHTHYVVSKKMLHNRTIALIEKADSEKRFREIAAMLSGEQLTRESLAQAKALVKEAAKSYAQ